MRNKALGLFIGLVAVVVLTCGTVATAQPQDSGTTTASTLAGGDLLAQGLFDFLGIQKVESSSDDNSGLTNRVLKPLCGALGVEVPVMVGLFACLTLVGRRR